MQTKHFLLQHNWEDHNIFVSFSKVHDLSAFIIKFSISEPPRSQPLQLFHRKLRSFISICNSIYPYGFLYRTTSSTQAPSTTAAPQPLPPHPSRWSPTSFIGGMVFAFGMGAIGFVAWKFYKARNERNYHTLWMTDDWEEESRVLSIE